MKFAICNETYGDWSIERTCEDVAACGYAGIEIAPYTLDPDPTRLDERRAAEVGRIAREAGLEVAGLHWLLVRPPGLHLTGPDDALRARTVALLRHAARLAGARGAGVMVLGSPAQRSVVEGDSPEDAFARGVEACRAVCQTAGSAGVTLAIEPLSPKLTDFLVSAAEALRFIAAVDHPACRLHLDVAAMSTEGRSYGEIIAEGAEELAHLHANDPNQGGPGFGEVDYAPIAAALTGIGYDGWVSVEVFDYTLGGPEIARRSLEYLRRVWGGIPEVRS